MARPCCDVARIVCANTVQQNEKRLHEARIKNQGKGRPRQDLAKFFSKLNQTVEETSSGKISDKLNLSCCNRSVTNCRYGPVLGFPPGSWWGIRMDCSRDRVHDPFDADIHEGPFGVVSVCTSHTNMNEDVDLGDFLTFTGQEYCEQHLDMDPFIHNYRNQIPLRLIRSYNLQNDIAPNTGYRYDGLYAVISYWIGAASDGTKYNKFALMRLLDQEPPSWSSKTSEDLSSARRSVSLSRSSHPTAYDLRRCSHNGGNVCGKRKPRRNDNREDLLVAKSVLPIDTSRKSVPESSIVTRHVFKKTPSSAESATSASAPDRKALTCLGASATKAHSTNISIRMGLYESSHNAQDTKKSVSTMLHKPSKPLDIGVRATLDAEGVRLTPKNDDKSVAKVDADKAHINLPPSENVSYNGYVAIANTDETDHPVNKRRRNLCPQVVLSSEYLHTVSLSLNSQDNGTIIVEHMEQPQERPSDVLIKLNANSEPVQKSNSDSESAQKSSSDSESAQKSNANDETPSNSVTIREKVTKSQDALEMPSEPLAQSIKSLDSLTPDKILNLINKEKHHPLSKLLIGNVIGLTTEEYDMLNESKVTASDPENKARVSSKVNLKRRRKGEDNVKENVACLDNQRYCRYSRSKRLSWNVKKQLEAGKFDKILPDRQPCNDADDKRNNNTAKDKQSGVSNENNEFLSPLRVQTSLPAIVQHTRSSYDIKTRLRADKGAVLEFPNSPMKKNRYKKQDREIANLSIDANFSPVRRGPRTRRLRCRNNVYASKRYCSTFNTVLYSSKRYKSSFKHNSRLTKQVNRPGQGQGRARDRPTKDRYKVSNTLHATSKDIDSSMAKQKNLKGTTGSSKNHDRACDNDDETCNNKKEDKITTVDVDDRGISKSSFDRSLRKRLVRTVTLPHRAAQTPRLNCFHKKQVEKAEKKPSTVDATTQCRLITENPEVYVIGQLDDQRAILKMEWDKLAKLKSESICGVILDEQDAEVYQAARLCQAAAFVEDGVCKDGELADPLQDATSAFVPVNAYDSDHRIARLRSIGFKPIFKPGLPSPPLAARDTGFVQNALVTASKVTKRDVAEEYDKYTNNEDNNVVVYLDDELQYQDIEEEDDESALVANTSARSVTLRSYAQSKVGGTSSTETTSCENSESPWHGWKKVVTNNRSYYIGW